MQPPKQPKKLSLSVKRTPGFNFFNDMLLPKNLKSNPIFGKISPSLSGKK